MEQGIPDILAIHAKIIEGFEEEAKKLTEYKTRLAELEKTARTANIPSRARNDLEKNILDLKHSIWKIQSEQEKGFYISEVAEILDQYRKILNTPIKMSFTSRTAPTVDPVKSDLIARYIAIASRFYCPETFYVDSKKNRQICDNCSNKKDFVLEENSYICGVCGCQEDTLQHSTSYKDADRVKISTKYTYDKKVHFRDSMNQYQGKQNCTIDQKVYDDLEACLLKHRLLDENATKKQARFAKVTKEHILMFLKELGYSKHYENVILIHYNLTGKPPDDISHLEHVLMSDFDALAEAYDKLFKNRVNRVNFISTQYVLYQLLRKHKHPCRKEDFVLLKTIERKNFHDSVMKELCSYLGWNFTPLV